jgi:transcriptional regulator
MKRRELIAGLAGAATAAATGSPEPSTETLYIPDAHRIEDLALLQELMDEYPFAELITTAPTLRITHIPVWLDRGAGKFGTLYGHVAKHNTQNETIDGHSNAVIVFHGPHAYISPSWYENPKAVPTWNFATVHASGKPQPVTAEADLYKLLGTLIARSENRYAKSNYDFDALPRSFTSSLMQGIVGFRMPVESLEGKFKLGQERSEKDKASIVSHLKASPGDRPIGEYTAAIYERLRR